MVIHGEPSPWRKKVKFVGLRLDFEGLLYDDYDLIEPSINYNLKDEVARRTKELMRDTYGRTVVLLRLVMVDLSGLIAIAGLRSSGLNLWLIIGILVVRYIALPVLGVVVIKAAYNFGNPEQIPWGETTPNVVYGVFTDNNKAAAHLKEEFVNYLLVSPGELSLKSVYAESVEDIV
ncbi:unnamed protein product [Ilex paraguariensis]|uniref:Uncharacterized protein n=1 Tax=Ilex paraguariensis TaxID=185542 RepID=A0ABC8RMS7_9AQUA